MNKKQLEFVIEEGEGLMIEFKESFDPKSLAKEMVSFANASGGKIFLGIDDKGSIKGIRITNKLKSQIQDVANNCDPAVRISLEGFDKTLIINVEEGNNKPHRCKEGFFARIGPNSQKMRRDKIIELAVSGGSVKFDEQINENFDFKKDFDGERLKRFLRENNLSAELDIKDILVSLGLAARKGKKLLLNNAGILLFAKTPQKFFLHAYLDCVMFKGKDRSEVIDRKTFHEGLLDQLISGKKFVQKHINLSYKFRGFEREEEYEIPLRAIEEALVNALMHRDYFFGGANISLFIYDDRLEIISPGSLPSGLDRKDFGRLSVRRNQIIADIFSRTPYVEKIGLGIKRIRSLLKEANLPPPEFEMNKFFIVTFKRKKNIEPIMSRFEPIMSRLNARQKKVISYLIKAKEITRLKYLDLTHASGATAKRDLKDLVEKKVLIKRGRGRGTKYVFR